MGRGAKSGCHNIFELLAELPLKPCKRGVMGWGLGGAQGGLSAGAAQAASEPSLFHAQAKMKGLM